MTIFKCTYVSINFFIHLFYIQIAPHPFSPPSPLHVPSLITPPLFREEWDPLEYQATLGHTVAVGLRHPFPLRLNYTVQLGEEDSVAGNRVRDRPCSNS